MQMFKKFLIPAGLVLVVAVPIHAISSVAVLDDSDGAALTAATKTATFESQTVNGGNADQLCLILDIGTVSGSTPTLNVKLQVTLDNGTTWLDTYPGASNAETQAAFTEITASKETMECYPNWLPSVGSFSASGIIPRMRFVFTIGGASPSFLFTNAYLVRREFIGGTS